VLDFLCLASRDFFHLVQIISFFFFVQQLSFRKTQEKGVRPSQNRLLPKTSYHVAAGSL
jgi:hypothetical protein